MKTIQQRLQSRLALRRNAIRQVEEDVALLVTQRRAIHDNGFSFLADGITDNIHVGKQYIKSMSEEQKLDKRLKQIVGQFDAERRYHLMPELA